MRTKEDNFISAVICLPHMDNGTRRFLDVVNGILADNFRNYELICVNDAVDGAVVETVRRFKADNPSVTVSLVNMGSRQGLEAAMNAGSDLAIGDYVFEFDTCYVDYRAELIMDVYRKSQEGFDIVSAVPPERESRVTSKLFYKVFNHFSASPYTLQSERFRIVSRRAVNRISAYSKTIPYRKAVYASVGLNITTVPYAQSPEKSGTRFEEGDRGGTAVNALVVFTDIAYKISLAFTMLMAVFMFAALLYTVVVYIGRNKPVEGWAPIMGLMSLGFFAMFAILSVIIKYADIILRLVFVRQKYLVASVDKL